MNNRFIRALISPSYLFSGIIKKCSKFIKDDKLYLSLRYFVSFGKKMNWDSPTTYNEKQQWLKLYDRNHQYTIMADKYLAKKYVAELIGDEYIIPTIGVWNNPEDIDWDQLPNQFAMKCNHNSGTGMIICKDKSKLDIPAAIKGLHKGLKEDYSLPNREWPYRNIPRKIIAEKFMVDDRYGELRDYKFFCFDGRVEFLFIATDRSKGDHAVCFDFFDKDFNHLDVRHGHPNAKKLPEKPLLFEEMKVIASKLSKGIPSSRIDLYEINGRIYFGEITFTHWGGFMPFDPPKWDIIFGAYINLPQPANNKCQN